MSGQSSPKVLFAWEHGHNFGHVSRMLALAHATAQAGAEPVWALPRARLDDEAFVRTGRMRWAAPTLARVVAARAPVSYADVLLGLGFADAAALLKAVQAWLQLFAQVRPAAVVLDYAPAAQLAAHLAGLRAAQVTNGFDAPPPGCPPFGWGVRGPYMERTNARKVAALDEVIRSVARAVGRDASLRSFLAHPTRWLDCVPETDPYGDARAGESRYVGPLGAPGDTEMAPWPDAAGSQAPRVFAYLRPAAPVWDTLRALAQAGANVLCVCPGAQATMRPELGPAVHVVERPAPMGEVLRSADAVVNYGSTTFVCQALLAGKPQLMLPSDVEKWLVSRRVAQAGAGVVVRGGDRLDDAVRLLRSRSLLHGAQDVAHRYARKDWAAELAHFTGHVVRGAAVPAIGILPAESTR